MTDLFEIIYVSQRSERVSDRMIVDEIVIPSGMNNRRLDITGILWFSEEHFLQVIEGPRDAIISLYQSIQRDSRHFDITTVSEGSIPQRSFKRWGLRALQCEHGQEITGLISMLKAESNTKKKALASTDAENISLQIRTSLNNLVQAEV